MKKISLAFAYIVGLIFFVAIFAPKQNLYFQFEKLLYTDKVVITKETLTDNLYKFEVSGGRVYSGDLLIADINSSRAYIFGLYNKIVVDSFNFAPGVEFLFPKNVEFITMTHSILNPLVVNVSSKGDFGDISGKINLKTKQVHLELIPSKMALQKYQATFMTKFKKADDKYVYQASF